MSILYCPCCGDLGIETELIESEVYRSRRTSEVASRGWRCPRCANWTEDLSEPCDCGALYHTDEDGDLRAGVSPCS